MHRKRIFLLAAVFLVVALVVPPVIVILQTNNTIYKYIIPGNNPVQGATNITIVITPHERANYNMAIILAAIIEVIFIVLFVITVFYGINHTHPEH
jgi:hypothetical protein